MNDTVESSASLVPDQNLLRKSPGGYFYFISFLFNLFIFLKSFWDVFESVIILPEEGPWLKYAVHPLQPQPPAF